MLIVRAITPQLAAWPDRLVNGVLTAGVWEPADSFKVTAPGGMNVRVGSGVAGDTAVVDGATALSGTYIVLNDAVSEDKPIAVGDATNPRIDLIVLRIYDDAFDSTGRTEAAIEVVEGTPAATPAAPALPAGAIALAEVRVEAGESTAIAAGKITDRRVTTRIADGLSAGQEVRTVHQPAAAVDLGTSNTPIVGTVSLPLPTGWQAMDIDVYGQVILSPAASLTAGQRRVKLTGQSGSETYLTFASWWDYTGTAIRKQTVPQSALALRTGIATATSFTLSGAIEVGAASDISATIDTRIVVVRRRVA